MRGLIDFFLDSKVAANLLALILVVSGILTANSLVVRLFPEINPFAVNITVPYPGASPEEVEEGIVEPIEEQLEGLEGVRKITAVAAENVANIVVQLYDGENTNVLVNDVRTEVGQISVFPDAAEEPQIGEVETTELIAQIVVYGDRDPAELKQLADRLRSRLTGTDTISRAELSGVADYLIEIAISEPRLRSLGLSLPELSRIVGSGSLDLSGGEIEDGQRRLLVRTMGENEIGEEFEEVVVATSPSGTPIRLRDIAEVHDGLSEEALATTLNGQTAVVVDVYRVGDERTFALIDTVRKEIERFRSEIGRDVGVTLWQDQSQDLRSRINLLMRNAVLGLLLVLGVLLLFLDVRIAFWVAVGVGISFVAALIPMGLTGIAISQLSLFGFILAIGIVVDDAIVVGENIHATMEEKDVEGTPAARKGVQRVALPVLFSVSTTICAFLPLILLPAQFGQFLGAIAAVVIFVLFMSLVESFFILPKHLSHLSHDAPPRLSVRRFAEPVRLSVAKRLDGFSQKRLRPAITASVRHPLVAMAIALGFLIATFGLTAGGIVKFVFFPAVEGNFVTAQLELAESASEAQTRRAGNRIADAARAAAEGIASDLDASPDEVLAGVLVSIGKSPASGGPPQGGAAAGISANSAYVTVKLQDAAVRKFTAKEFEDLWRKETGRIPGAQNLSFSADLVNSGAAVTIQVAGEDDEVAREALGALRREVENIPGTVSVRDDRFRTTEELQVRLLPQARAAGVTLQEVATQVRASFFGAEAVRVQRDREEIEVRLRLTREERANIESLTRNRIFVNGEYVPIDQVATVEIGDAPSVINRQNGRQIFSLESDVDLGVTTGGAVSAKIFGEIWPRIQSDYPNVEIVPGGEQEDQNRMQSALSRNFLFAMLAIYTLLALAFGSYSQPFVVLGVIPFGLIGAIVGHAMLGINLTLLSLFGIIGLSGVIINDALLMVDYINEALREGKARAEAIIEAAVSRFRPIILTSITTFLGVTPIILEQSVQAAFLVPTAVSLGFGILFGTFILILVVPALASLHLRLRERLKKAASTLKDTMTPSEEPAE